MQSGISGKPITSSLPSLRPAPPTNTHTQPPTASQELQTQFTTLLTSPSTFALLATIEKEQLVPLALLERTSPTSTFATDLTTQLAPHLQPKTPLYILLRRHAAAPHLTAVTYVPDAAPVRSKMLFASSRLTLVRDLGSEHVRDTIFATTAEELTPRGFEKHEKHEGVAAPLTEEERLLGEVKRAEAEAGQGTGSREIHLSKTFAMPVGEGVLERLRELGAGQGTLVMLVSWFSVRDGGERSEDGAWGLAPRTSRLHVNWGPAPRPPILASLERRRAVVR